jgi:putative membrane fusion protein
MEKKKRAKASRAEILKRRKIFLRRLVIFSILIVVAGLSFGVYHLYRQTVSRILVFQSYQQEEVKVTVISKGIVLIDEEVMIAPESGTWSPLVEPLTMVEVNDPLAEIYDLSSLKVYEKKTAELADLRKKDLEEYNSRLSFYDESVKEIEKEISDIEKQMKTEALKDDAEAKERLSSRIETLEEKIEDLQKEKAQVEYNSEIWDEEEEALKDVLKTGATVVQSNYSGTISFSIDGYENILTTSKLPEMSVKDFEAFNYLSRVKMPEELAAGKPFAKVIKTPILCVSLYDLKDVLSLAQGDRVKLLLGQESLVEAEVLQIEQEDEQVLLTYIFYLPLPELLDQRFPIFELVILEEMGMKVPSDLLVQKQGSDGVFVVENETAHFKQVNILQNRQGEALISGLGSEAKIILNPRFALEGIRVEGE